MSKKRGTQSIAGADFFESQDEDRRRIARQLHDTVAQRCVALQINLSLIDQSHSVLDRRASQALSDAVELAQELSVDIREIASTLYPPLLDQLGLAAAIETCAQRLSKETGLKMELDLPSELGRLPPPLETALFRTVEQCLSNAAGKTGKLKLARGSKSLVLELTVPGVVSGIKTVRERARLLGGRLTIQRRPRETRLRMVLPIACQTAGPENPRTPDLS